MKRFIFCLAVSLLAAAASLSAASGKPSAASLLQEGNGLLARGDAREAAAKLEQGLALAQKSAGKSGENGFYIPLGEAYTALGEYHKAIFFLTEALARAERRKDGRAVSTALLYLGAAHAACGEDRRAVSCYKDALKIARAHGSRKNVGRICAGLGGIYSRLGASVRAVGYYSDALNILKSTASRRELYDLSLNLGRAHADLQEYGKALAAGSDALKLAQSLGAPELIAAALSATGRAETGLGRIGDAEKHFEAAAKIYDKANDFGALKADAGCLSGWYRDQGDPEKAAACYDNVQRSAEKAGDKQALLDCLRERGRIFEQARDYRKALYYYAEAAKTGGDGNGKAPGDLGLLTADLYARTGETAAAEERFLLLGDPVRLGFLELGKKNYRKAQDQFIRVLRDAERWSEGTVFAARTGLGEAFVGLKDPAQAERYFDEAAGQLGTPGPGMSAGLDLPPYPPGFSRIAPLERLVELRAGRGALPEAFYASEQVKSVLFEDAVDMKGMRQDVRVLPPDLEREEGITVSRLSLLGREVRLLSRTLMVEDAEAAREDHGNLQARFRKLVGKIREYDPEYASFAYPAPLKPEEILLGPSEALLEFEVTRDRTYLFVIDGKSREMLLRTVPLDRRALAELVSAYRSSLQNGTYDAGRGKKLFKALFDDLLDRFPAGTTLVVVPDEELASLSFESLPEGKSTDRKKNGRVRFPAPRGIRYLGDSYRVLYAQSARSFNDRKERKEPPAGGQQVLLVDPVVPAAALSGGAYEERRATAAAMQSPEIPGGDILKNMRVMLGTSAVTVSALLPAERKPDAYRCLVLGPGLPFPGAAARLDAVMGLRSRAASAIVPRIDTGDRSVRTGGVAAAGRAFQFAGCGSALFGLWPVPADVTGQLCGAYLREMLGGKEPKDALAAARDEVRAAGFENPFYWAGFVLTGY